MHAARYLEDGRLTIFKRSGIFYARIRLSASGKYIWRSLKTTDEQTAIRAGRRLLFHLEHRVDQGLPPKSKLFSAVIDDYVRFRERDNGHGKTSDGMLRQIIRVAKFWRDYAGGMPVEAIDDKVMRDRLSEMVGVVGRVGHDDGGPCPCKHSRLRNVPLLAWGEDKADRASGAAHRKMNLGAQAAKIFEAFSAFKLRNKKARLSRARAYSQGPR
jgi:hypothetical protein